MTSDLNIPALSVGTLNIFPALNNELTITDQIRVGDQATLRYYQDDTNLQGITFQDGLLAGINRITLIESV